MDQVIKTSASEGASNLAKTQDEELRQRAASSSGSAKNADSTVVRDWKRPAAIGYGLITFTFVVLGAWSATAKLDSAVTAPGFVAEENSRKSVQHLEGGIVKEILVREGQH